MLDINLLPKKEKKISGGTTVIIILISITYVISAGILGFILPLQKKEVINKRISRIKEDIESYNVNEVEYYLLEKTVNDKRHESEVLLELRNNRLDITELLDNIEASMPVEIYFEQLNISGGVLNIEGYSPDYQNIAKFIVKLRSVNNLNNTAFTTASLEKEDGKELYYFNLYGNLDQMDIITELTQSENFNSQTDEGGNSEQ